MMSVRVAACIVRIVVVMAIIVIASRVVRVRVPSGIIASAVAPVGVARPAIGVAMTISVAIAPDMRISAPAAYGVSMAATMNNAHRRMVNPSSDETMMKRGSAGVKSMSVNSGSRKPM
jgi:hypothetical protein